MLAYFLVLYKDLLFALFLIIPFFIVGCKNKVLLRIFISSLLLWIYLFYANVLINFVDLKFGDELLRQKVFDSDGARGVFAAFFGWIPALCMSLVAWCVLKLADVVKRRLGRKS